MLRKYLPLVLVVVPIVVVAAINGDFPGMWP